ncbi:vacuolar sorting protein VPS33/slp1 [Agyrium rufum]|nr:vacuolar sorting protein VPS33/slp1 [Agyrium rufum]
MNPQLDAVYILSPESHIVDYLLDDFHRRRYRRSFLTWTSLLYPDLRARLDSLPHVKQQIAHFRTLNIDFYPRESHLITFRDPWSFPVLYHPACNQSVRDHLEALSQKIVSVCVSLGEYPTIRYYKPRHPLHAAAVLCSHLARFVQEGLDQHAKFHNDFPPPSPRPRGILMITDRTMDMFAPLLHEFTYQAMAHDLLPLKDGDRTFYKTVVNEGGPNQEEKDMELSERDKIWVTNRHLHMKDLLEKLVADFKKFRADNPQFAESDDNPSTLNNIKDMIAGLPQFQEGKEAYSLHLNMAQACMSQFQERQLPNIGTLEQSMATGLDEDYKKPKNLTDQMVRLLDDDNVDSTDRLRLIIEYILYRDGIFPSDIEKLLLHAQLPAQDGEVVNNLELLGVRVVRPVKDTKLAPTPLFPRKLAPTPGLEDVALSRYDPGIKLMIEEHLRGTLDQSIFPFTKPLLDANDGGPLGQTNVSQASLRSAKPTWARTRPSALEPRQRIIVFMAGGATYSESRVCYDISNNLAKDVYLASSHMLTPKLFLRQIRDLSVDRRQLDLPMDRPKTKANIAPPERPPAEDKPQPQPPTEKVAGLKLDGRPSPHKSTNSESNGSHAPKVQPQQLPPVSAGGTAQKGKLSKEPKEKGKKRGFFKSLK